MFELSLCYTMYSCCLCFVCLLGFSGSQDNLFNQAKNYEGSSDVVDLQCFSRGLFWLHLPARTLSGMVIGTIRDFIYSLSSSPPYPSVADWWRAVRFHTDQMDLAGKECFKILAFFPGFSRNGVLFKVHDARHHDGN